MDYRDLIRQTAKDCGIDEKQTSSYVRAFFEAAQRSVSKYEPVAVRDLLELRIHKYIFEKKQYGLDLPMPEGVGEAIQEAKADSYNSRRKPGTFVRFNENQIGVVIRQIGDEQILVKPLMIFEDYYIGKYKRTMWREEVGQHVLLQPENYPRKGSVKHWLGMKIRKIDPVVSVQGLMRKLQNLKHANQ